jgi:endonuclease YncB( thermonuclease family)
MMERHSLWHEAPLLHQLPDTLIQGQAYGKKAKQTASEMVFGKEVTLQTYGKDKYGRTLAKVFLPDGTNVNHELVKDGWCWWYPKYAPGGCRVRETRN